MRREHPRTAARCYPGAAVTGLEIVSAAERRALRELARGVIRAQGNVFIKELLRAKKLRIGATKEDFERNLFAAIDAGQLRLADVEKWLTEVEGWGNQHVYLFNVSKELAGSPALASTAAMRRKVMAAGLESVWEAETSQVFPDTPQLTSIRYDGDTLRLLWHEGVEGWARGREEKELDYRKEQQNDVYEFRAYRQFLRRAVMRFELRRGEALAATFLSVAIEEPTYKEARLRVEATIARLLDFEALRRGQVLVGEVIKKLDQGATVGAKPLASVVRSHSTRMTGKTAYLELGSKTEDGSYLDDEVIGGVRQSIRGKALARLAGASASFEILQEGLPGLPQDVRLFLYGTEKRVRIWKLLKSEEVWTILRFLASHQ